nr:reverse transcriptase domain-containing protein [Tanacetum cinerariifolium]
QSLHVSRPTRLCAQAQSGDDMPYRIDFMGPFSSSRGNKYILIAVDYLSKWVEAKALLTNDARVVCKFMKNLFARFGFPRAIISDQETHFCNDQFRKVMLKYGVTHRLATTYHPQTSEHVWSIHDMNTASFSGMGTLPSNKNTNRQEDLKGITTRSGDAYQGTTIPTTSSFLPKVVERETEVTKDTVQPTNNESTKDIPPPVVQAKTSI